MMLLIIKPSTATDVSNACRRALQLSSIVGPVLVASMPGVAAADGYDFPVVVERASVIEVESMQLGESIEVINAAELIEVPSIEVPAAETVVVEAPVETSAPRSEDVEPILAASLEPTLEPTSESTLVPNGGHASAGYVDGGTTLSLYASEKVIRTEYERDQEVFGAEDARVSAGFLMSELRDVVITGTANLNTFPGLIPKVNLSVGPKLYVALLGVENRDIFGLGIGARGSYELPLEALPLSISGSFHYTPDILSFGQSDRIIDWSVDAGLRLRDNLSAFAGLRFLSFDTRPGTRKVEDDIHVGITWHFDDAADDL